MLRLSRWTRGALASLLVLGLIGPATGRALAAPQLVVRDPVFDFGAVFDDAPLTRTFLLENAGDAPLTITNIRPGCPECTRFTLERDVIPAGESATLVVTLETVGLEDDVTKELTLETNDPKALRATLTLRGHIMPRFECHPKTAIMELASTNAFGSTQVTINPRRAMNMPLTEVTSDSPLLYGVVAPDADGAFTLQIYTRPPLPTGILHGHLRVASADTNDPVCTVKVDLGVWPGFLAVPDVLRFEEGVAGQMRILFVRQFPDTPHSIQSVEDASGNLACEIYPEPAGLNYRIYVYAREVAAAGAGTLLIHTDDPEQPTLSVPYAFEH
ncbi:MAG: DUF1573 domain-containing protein [Lentisphaerae bacterium]|nr:DUF1573 domain-containing protein [Lentisphaerota bacterium]